MYIICAVYVCSAIDAHVIGVEDVVYETGWKKIDEYYLGTQWPRTDVVSIQYNV